MKYGNTFQCIKKLWYDSAVVIESILRRETWNSALFGISFPKTAIIWRFGWWRI